MKIELASEDSDSQGHHDTHGSMTQTPKDILTVVGSSIHIIVTLRPVHSGSRGLRVGRSESSDSDETPSRGPGLLRSIPTRITVMGRPGPSFPSKSLITNLRYHYHDRDRLRWEARFPQVYSSVRHLIVATPGPSPGPAGRLGPITITQTRPGTRSPAGRAPPGRADGGCEHDHHLVEN